MTTKTLLEMRRLYDQKLPDAKIAKAVGVSIFSVFHWRRGNGLPCWKNYYEVRDRMTDDLIASGTAKECAEAMGYPQCADTDKTAAPGGACRRRIHLHAECKSRNPTRSHGNSGEGVAAQYRLSAPTGRPENDVSSCLLNPELRQVARNRESSERAALFMVVVGKYTAQSKWVGAAVLFETGGEFPLWQRGSIKSGSSRRDSSYWKVGPARG